MKMSVVGAGYVGLVTGTCLAELGHEVILIENDPKKVHILLQGEIPIYEPGLKELFKKNLSDGKIAVSQDLKNSVKQSKAIFIAVGTPSSRRGDGEADISFVIQAVKALAKHLPKDCIVINKSTVPVGTTRTVQDLIKQENPKAVFHMASNPEFLREGAAIKDFMQPDRIILGVETQKAKALMMQIYSDFSDRRVPILATTFETAELIKYASNSFLATKISFMNEMAAFCESVHADIEDLSKGMGLDTRIGEKFLQPGPGYGGSCFPKDTLALAKMAKEKGCTAQIIEATVGVNQHQKDLMLKKITKSLGGLVSGKTLAVLGLTFKADTDDVRESPALKIIAELLKAGLKINANDPVGMVEAKKIIPEASFFEDPYLACKGADGVCLLTEWDCYREIDLKRIKSLLAQPLLIDLRNVFSLSKIREIGFNYVCLGREEICLEKMKYKVV